MFVAMDVETGELLATHSFKINRRKKSATGYILAVSPKAKREGIATRMLAIETDYIIKAGCTHLLGNTAVTAPWSVKWHLKNGYRIVGYKRSSKNSYYSYVFRKQLSCSFLWSGPLAPMTAHLSFCVSYAITRLCKTSTGQLTLLGRVAKKILRVQ